MSFRIDVHHHLHCEGQEQTLALLKQILTKGNMIMATLKDIQDNEAHEGTALGQLATAVTALRDGQAALQQQLADALAGTTLPTQVQADVDAAFASAKANSDQVDAILTSLAPVPAPVVGGATPA